MEQDQSLEVGAVEPRPDYLPARMLNEFVYCPRLFYYEWVEGVFADNTDTVEGRIRHAAVDSKEEAFVSPKELDETDELRRARSVMLSSDTHRLIARMDILEAREGMVTPVDFKRGAPRKTDDGPAAWEPDRVQIAAQALILRDNGYRCEEGVVYYASTKQRVRIAVDEALVAATLKALDEAWKVASAEKIPPPLVDSPKCPRCSLVAICLPDETNLLAAQASGAGGCETGDEARAASGPSEETEAVRRLVAARDDLRPLYLNTQGLSVGKSGGTLTVKEDGKVLQTVRLNEISQLNVYGNIQVSTQAVQTLLQSDIPIAYYSQGGWYYGTTHGLGVKNIFLRREQFRRADDSAFCLDLARRLVAGKVHNCRVLLQRNHIEPPQRALDRLKCLEEEATRIDKLESLLGVEGNAARIYFEAFSGMLKLSPDGESDPLDHEAGAAGFSFDFNGRTKRPPTDPVNALLSLAYSVLSKDMAITCHNVGFDPYLGFYHQPRFGRPALALDLMEPFRPLIADSTVLSAINTRMVTPGDFLRTGVAVALKESGRKAFFRAYEQRMDALVTHPLLGYRVSYRRVLEIQTRLLARMLEGEIPEYPVFTTR